MMKVIRVPAEVVEVHGVPTPETPGLADDITYTVDILDEGGFKRRFVNVKPNTERWAAPQLVRPIKPGTLIGAVVLDGFRVQIEGRELPHVADCPPPGPGGGDSPGTMLLNAVRGMNPAQRAELRALLTGVGV